VFTPTIRDQMDGQTDRVLAAVSADYTRLATQAGVTDGGPLPVPSLARITGYRVAGDPATGAVTVHLLVESGAGERDFAVPLVWAGQQPDWRLLAPAPGASTLFAVAEPSGDYTPVPEAQR
jgi:hypothetical protein